MSSPSSSSPSTITSSLKPAGRLLQLLEDYQDLSPPSGTYRTLHVPPTGMEALRMIMDGRPVIIRGMSVLLPPSNSSSTTNDPRPTPIDLTSPSSLSSLFPPDHLLSIAVTDDGMADSVRVRDTCEIRSGRGGESGDVGERRWSGRAPGGRSVEGREEGREDEDDEDGGKEYFVQPLTEKMSMSDFLERLLDPHSDEVHYLQSQNGNVYRHSFASDPTTSTSDDPHAKRPDCGSDEPRPELAILQKYLVTEIPFMREALGGKGPDAVNLWIGGKGSRTSLHRDPYENIYHVLSGTKTFTVLSPLEGYLLRPKFYPPAALRRRMKDIDRSPSVNSSTASSLEVHPDQDAKYLVPWVKLNPTRLPPESPLRPITIKVSEGETLYLPAGWWHWVEQEEGDGGICVAVNYWYDQTLDPQRYAMDRYIWRNIGRADMVD